MATLEIRNDFTDEVLLEKNKDVERALEAIGLKAEAYAKKALTVQKAVRTGNLRNSVTHESDGQTVQVGTNTEYASYVEYGTYKMDARPYIEPSIKNHIDEYRELFIQFLKD